MTDMLDRYVNAQASDYDYEQAVRELEQGSKEVAGCGLFE